MMFSAFVQLVNDFWCYLLLFSTKLDSISWVYILLYLGILFLIVLLYFVSHFASFCANHEKLHRFVGLVVVNQKTGWIERKYLVGAIVCAILLSHCSAPRNETSANGSANSGTTVVDYSKMGSDYRLPTPSFKCVMLCELQAVSTGDQGNKCSFEREPQERLMSTADGIMCIPKKQHNGLLRVDFSYLQSQFDSITFWSVKTWMTVFAYKLSHSQQNNMYKRMNVGSPVAMKLLIGLLFIPSSYVSVFGLKEQTFKIVDPQGYETSYLYEGGKLIITCYGNGQDPVAFKTKTTKNNKPFTNSEKEKKPPFVKEILLKSSMVAVETRYKCGDLDGPFLKIKAFQCNPFLMDPPIKCKNGEVCLVNDETSSKCAKMREDDCFLVAKSEMNLYYEELYPKPRAACVTNDALKSANNENTRFGLCHARVVTNSTFVGLASSMGDCHEIKDLVFNGKTVRQDMLLFTNKTDPSSWTISYSSKKHTKMCVAYDSENAYANFTAEHAPEKLSLKFTSQEQMKLPSKLKLHCVMSQFDEDTVISNFLIVYDGNKVPYKAVIKAENSTDINALDLVCKCDIPKGFQCSLGWEKPKTNEKSQYSEVKSIIRKTIYEADHKDAIEYSCFMEIWVFNYPVSYDLIKVPEIGVISSTKLIKNKDFVSAVPKPSGYKNGTTGTHEGHNGDHGKDDNQSTSGSQNNKTAIAFGIVGALLAVIALIAIIAMVVVIRRRSANTKALKSSPSRPHEPELDMSRVIKLRGDVDHERSLEALIDFDNIKATLRTAAQQLKPNNPEYARALRVTPFCNIADEWDCIQTSCEQRKDNKEAICGYLQECRFPSLAITKNTFVFKESAGVLVDTAPTAAQIDEWRRNPSKPVALNANIVKDIHLKDMFILTQAPRLSDMEIFFEMILQKNTPLIVTLSEVREIPDIPAVGIRGVYFPYYNLKQGRSFSCGSFTLSCILLVADPNARSETRSCKLIKKNKTSKTEPPKEIQVTILSYLKWGDFSSPTDCSHVLSVLSSMKQILHEIPKNPLLKTSINTNDLIQEREKLAEVKVVIHCSGGLGRSGVLVAAYNIIEYIERYGLPVNLFQICEFVRQEREGAIISLDQYLQLYWFTADFVRTQFAKTAPKFIPKSEISSVVKSKHLTEKRLTRSQRLESVK